MRNSLAPHQGGEEVGEAKSKQVGSQEAARDQPAAALQTTTGEELACVVVDGGDQVASAGMGPVLELWFGTGPA